MKKVRLVAITGVLMSAVLLLASCNNTNTAAASASAPVGVVDVMAIMQSPEIQALGSKMMGQDSSAQANLKKAYEELQSANAAVKSAKAANKAAAEAKAKGLQESFNKQMAAFQGEQQKQQNQLKEAITNAIATVAKAKNLSSVYMKQVVLYGTQTDITSDVVAELKK
jgi:Skp family chaperone for outer membrane proteins